MIESDRNAVEERFARFSRGRSQGVKDSLLNVDLHARVTMSPQHAKVFAQVLMENVAKWEQTLVLIVVTPSQAAETAAKKLS
jgi:Protein of unknown function (DUF3467)